MSSLVRAPEQCKLSVMAAHSPELTVVIPTVPSRRHLLQKAIDSVLMQHSDETRLLISGNGTGPLDPSLEDIPGVTTICTDRFLSAHEHGLFILDRWEGEYIWFLADDDQVAPGAIRAVRRVLSSGPRPSAVVGRIQRFQEPDLSDLSPPEPNSWTAGPCRSLDEALDATRGQVSLSALIMRRPLVNYETWTRYRGTAHETFGLLWDGLHAENRPLLIALDETLAYSGTAPKEWDYFGVEMDHAVARFLERVPRQVAHAMSSRGLRLDRRSALRFASTLERGDRALAIHYANAFSEYSLGAKMLLKMHPYTARLFAGVDRLMCEVRSFRPFY